MKKQTGSRHPVAGSQRIATASRTKITPDETLDSHRQAEINGRVDSSKSFFLPPLHTGHSDRPTMSEKPRSVEAVVATRLAALRREVGLTLRELAAKTGLSDAYLSRVENGRIAVTLASLEKLAAVFATPITTFFEEEIKPRRFVLCRAGRGRKARFRGRSGTLVELLADEKHSKLMEPLIADVASATKPVEPLAHPGEEFNYVISGTCKFVFGGDVQTLSAGDSVYFDATIPHAMHAVRGEPCQLLAVVTSRDFQMHRNIGKVLEERLQA